MSRGLVSSEEEANRALWAFNNALDHPMDEKRFWGTVGREKGYQIGG